MRVQLTVRWVSQNCSAIKRNWWETQMDSSENGLFHLKCSEWPRKYQRNQKSSLKWYFFCIIMLNENFYMKQPCLVENIRKTHKIIVIYSMPISKLFETFPNCEFNIIEFLILPFPSVCYWSKRSRTQYTLLIMTFDVKYGTTERWWERLWMDKNYNVTHQWISTGTMSSNDQCHCAMCNAFDKNYILRVELNERQPDWGVLLRISENDNGRWEIHGLEKIDVRV